MIANHKKSFFLNQRSNIIKGSKKKNIDAQVMSYRWLHIQLTLIAECAENILSVKINQMVQCCKLDDEPINW